MNYRCPVLFSIIVLILSSCSENKQQSDNGSDPMDSIAQPSPQLANKQVEKPDYAQLIIGSWQSLDDPKSYITFTEDKIIYAYDGQISSETTYSLGSRCANLPTSAESNTNQYISSATEDMCWSIIKLDQNDLHLLYIARGNTLKYQKVHTLIKTEKDKKTEIMGTIVGITETGIYGLFNVDIETEGVRHTYLYEEEYSRISTWLDQKVKVGLKEVVSNEEIDLHHNGKSIFGKNGRVDADNKSNFQSIEGIIHATSLSGDTPDTYTVAAKDGTSIPVVAFVNSMHVAQNGNKVTLYYHVSTTTQINTIEAAAKLNTKEQVAFIRDKFGIITKGKADGSFPITGFQVESGGEFVQYERAMQGENVVFLSVAYCNDHGCDKTSYYFWDSEIIFIFKENSSWVGQMDTVEEFRSYYYNGTAFKCISRSLTASGGFETVKAKLAQTKQVESDCSEEYDPKKVEPLFQLQQDNAEQYFYGN